jgi:hypothetical protein
LAREIASHGLIRDAGTFGARPCAEVISALYGPQPRCPTCSASRGMAAGCGARGCCALLRVRLSISTAAPWSDRRRALRPLGTGAHLSAQIGEKRTQFSASNGVRLGRENSLNCRDCALLERFRPTTENRGPRFESGSRHCGIPHDCRIFHFSEWSPLHPRLGTPLGTDAPMAVDRSGAESQE